MVDRISGQRSPLIRVPKELRWCRRLFRFLFDLIVPGCTCQAVPSLPEAEPASTATGSFVTGTIYGRRTERVSFCFQEDPRTLPALLVELPVLTSYLANEMRDGMVRIALQCSRTESEYPLWDVPFWTAFCNGRKIGFAESKKVSEDDLAVLKPMVLVSSGAGILPTKADSKDSPVIYLRASFSRVTGSSDSESFHLINPAGCTGQELSIFLLRK